ncbi:7-deoxyloganetic acid glucosyltransferase [Bienertia sinuspersici]
MDQQSQKAHILIFPLPIQGPVNSMLKLAELILIASQGQIQVTFLTTIHTHTRLNLHAKAATRFSGYPSFSFVTFPDGLPEDHPRGGDKFMEMLNAVEGVSQPLLRDMMLNNNSSHKNDDYPITCLISDGLFHFAVDLGKENGIPVIYFETMSLSCLWVYLCLPKFIEAGEVPFQENEGMEAILTLPGIRGLLRRCDLPDFCRANNSSSETMIQRIIELEKQYNRASALIFNTFEDLEAPLLSYIRAHHPYNMYVIGPLHLHLKEKLLELEATKATPPPSTYCSNSIWREDNSCIEWLNRHPRRSVIYCSFGSQVTLSKEQLIEFWHGLVNSGFRFLWVKRPRSVIGMEDDVHNKWHEQIPDKLLKGVMKNGYVVTWAPQEEILNHPSIGGFFTHSGWNSTIESLVAGVPMICWPHYVDQLVISRYVSHFWKVGLDMKDSCDRVILENMVRDVMCKRKDEFLQNANALANLAKQSVENRGSSCRSLDMLVDEIMSFRLPV